MNNNYLKLLGCFVILSLSACSQSGVEGTWTEPVPGLEGQVQGICLEKGGKASSVNMATLVYESWTREGDCLILSGKSIGNTQTISFADTFHIEKLSADELDLKKGALVIHYRREK